MTVSIEGHKATGVADTGGRWAVQVLPPKAGGPYVVEVSGPQKVELRDVLVGDVWLCTGQSNMEMGLTVAKDGAKDVAAANDSNLRLYMAPRQVAYHPLDQGAAPWKVCTPQSVAEQGWGGFSAVGYHFGHMLRERLGVPIGLVSVNWGGTTAEAWTSREGLQDLPDFRDILAHLERRDHSSLPVANTSLDLWLSENDAGSKSEPKWQDPALDASDWRAFEKPIDVPGVYWLRREVDLPSPLPAGDAMLHLGKVGAIDQTWVNGHLLGYNDDPNGNHEYGLWQGSINPGKNVVVTRLIVRSTDLSHWNVGGTTISIGASPAVTLDGGWKVRTGVLMKDATALPSEIFVNPDLPSVLFNGMVAPLAPLAIRGVIWYQGESNAGRSQQYRRLLPALIADWRHKFQQGVFPFYIVSLASWMERRAEPGDDGWAELREAQALTAAHTPKSGLAITIDVGDVADVHPKDKKTVGERLARIALAQEFGQNIAFSGPVLSGMRIDGSSIRLQFHFAESGLVAKGKLEGFQIAGEDRHWHWAEATIDGASVIVQSSSVKKPVAVRYAWEIGPRATLFNGAGLPAGPFRTDDWPGITK